MGEHSNVFFWPTAAVPPVRRKQPLEMRAFDANGSLPASSRTHTIGHNRSFTSSCNGAAGVKKLPGFLRSLAARILAGRLRYFL